MRMVRHYYGSCQRETFNFVCNKIQQCKQAMRCINSLMHNISDLDTLWRQNWRSSIRCIDPGRDSLSSEGWRSSINVNQSKCDRGEDLQWRPGIRVFKLSENCIDRKVKYGRRHLTAVSHDEPFWHTSRGSGKPPPSKWSPPFRNMISASINVCKRKSFSYVFCGINEIIILKGKTPEYSSISLFPSKCH